MLKAIVWIVLSLGVTSAVAVEVTPKARASWSEHRQRDWDRQGDLEAGGDRRGDSAGDRIDRRSPAAAPEIDPAGALSSLTLLVGGLAVLRGRGLKKK